MTDGEKKALRIHLDEARKAGFVAYAVDDGGDEAQPVGGADPESADASVIAAVGAVDDARVFLAAPRAAGGKPRRSWLYCVNGNAKDGSELIADHGAGPGDFALAMERAYTRCEVEL